MLLALVCVREREKEREKHTHTNAHAHRSQSAASGGSIGMLLALVGGGVTVVELVAGLPAAASGLIAVNDVLLAVDGTGVEGWSLPQARSIDTHTVYMYTHTHTVYIYYIYIYTECVCCSPWTAPASRAGPFPRCVASFM